jgi:hypothetical protein
MMRISSSASPSLRNVPARFINSRVFEPSRATARSNSLRAAMTLPLRSSFRAVSLRMAGCSGSMALTRMSNASARARSPFVSARSACEISSLTSPAGEALIEAPLLWQQWRRV